MSYYNVSKPFVNTSSDGCEEIRSQKVKMSSVYNVDHKWRLVQKVSQRAVAMLDKKIWW